MSTSCVMEIWTISSAPPLLQVHVLHVLQLNQILPAHSRENHCRDHRVFVPHPKHFSTWEYAYLCEKRVQQWVRLLQFTVQQFSGSFEGSRLRGCHTEQIISEQINKMMFHKSHLMTRNAEFADSGAAAGLSLVMGIMNLEQWDVLQIALKLRGCDVDPTPLPSRTRI